jgi:UDP-glucuronate 4-epimerase
MQTGDVKDTFANVEDLFTAVGFKPQTTIEDGIPKFVKWYRDYYRV